jgi:hypothetical protein
MLIHSIEADDVMQAMSVANKLNADWDQVNKLMKVSAVSKQMTGSLLTSIG